MKLFFVWLSLFSIIFANTIDEDSTADYNSMSNNQLQKVLYLNYEKIPKRVLKGEIFAVSIKVLSTIPNFTDVTYKLSNLNGLKLLTEFPVRDNDNKYYYETFYYLATSSHASLPDIEATLLNYNEDIFKTTILEGVALNTVALNPKNNFSNILANTFNLLDYKTTSYDQTHNIVVFTAEATNCDIASLKLKNIYKQGIESVVESYIDSRITYYVIISKDIKTFSFSYFNLKKNRFINIDFPIIVNDDSVTTQSDLKPKNQSHELLKMQIAATLAIIFLIFSFWRKKYIYLIFTLLLIAYVAYIAVPSEEICIKQGSKIQLLPMQNGTIFKTTPSVYYLQKEGQTKKYTKVKLKNQKIGWIKNEDICSH